MFDLEHLKFQDDIAKQRQAAMLESSKLEMEENYRKRSLVLEALSKQYESMHNTQVSNAFEFQSIVENATINSVKNTMYSIFENALLLDESVKDMYSETFKSIFSSKFDEVLKENSVTTLKQFTNMLSESHDLLNVVLETSHKFVANNATIYKELLESFYNKNSIRNLVLETYSEITSDSGTPQSREDALNKLSSEIMGTPVDTNQRVSMGDNIPQLLTLASLIAEMNKPYRISKNALLAVSYFLTALKTVSDNPSQKEYFREYRSQLIDTKDRLNAILSKLSSEDDGYNTVARHLTTIDSLLDNNLTSEELNESVDIPTLCLEAEEANYNYDDEKVVEILVRIQSELRDTRKYFNAYKGLEILRALNSLLSQAGIQERYDKYEGIVDDMVYIITSSAHVKNVPVATAENYVAEAEKLRNSLQGLLPDGTQYAESVEKKVKCIDQFISAYQHIIKGQNVAPTITTIDNLMSEPITMAQFINIYESGVDDIKAITNLLREDHCGDVHDRNLLIHTISNKLKGKSVTDPVWNQYIQLEAAAYEGMSYKLDFISEDAHEKLSKGEYPNPDDFLDDNEKEIVDAMANVNSKDKAVKIIKDKVIEVITSEEERTKKREEEETELLNKMTPDEVNRLKSSVQESSSDLRLGSVSLNVPETLFESIVMNRSKAYIKETLNEGASVNISDNKDMILAESIVLYTIHETFNTLGFQKFDQERIHKLMNDYYYSKI